MYILKQFKLYYKASEYTQEEYVQDMLQSQINPRHYEEETQAEHLQPQYN